MTSNSQKATGPDLMTEWLKLERLPENNLQLPKYETAHSAGLDFSACLTRPCRQVPEGATFKETQAFVCCDPLQACSYYNFYVSGTTPEVNRLIASNKRLRVDPNDESWKSYTKASPIRLCIYPGETVMVSLGFKCEFGVRHVLMLHARSSTGMRGLELANSTGIIDPDYRGELWAVIYNRNKETPIIIEHGDRLVQGVMLATNQPLISESNVCVTNRGEGGFGSTGTGIRHGEGAEGNPQPESKP